MDCQTLNAFFFFSHQRMIPMRIDAECNTVSVLSPPPSPPPQKKKKQPPPQSTGMRSLHHALKLSSSLFPLPLFPFPFFSCVVDDIFPDAVADAVLKPLEPKLSFSSGLPLPPSPFFFLAKPRLGRNEPFQKVKASSRTSSLPLPFSRKHYLEETSTTVPSSPPPPPSSVLLHKYAKDDIIKRRYHVVSPFSKFDSR